MTRYHECPDCYGSGYRYYDVSIDPSARLMRDTCTTCDGEGFLTVEVAPKSKHREQEKAA